MQNISIGIIGMGNRGTELSNIITEGKVQGLELKAVADVNPKRLEWAEANLPGVQRFSDGAELIKSRSVEAVIVAVPHYSHPGLCLAALKQGMHVICEKPVGVYTKAIHEVNEYADKCGLTYAMMFNQRTNCVYRKMKEIIESGSMGAIRRTNWIITTWFRNQKYYDSGSWRATWDGEGGGVLINQCPHNIDLWQWICGMPVRVHAFAHNGLWHDIEVEDDVTAYVEYANHATGVLITSTGDTPGTNRLEVTLDKGSLVCENGILTQNLLETSIPDFMNDMTANIKRPKCTSTVVETDGLNKQSVGVMEAFVDHIRKGTPLIATGQEGINELTLSNAIHLSAWTNRTVELPFDEDEFLAELNKRRLTSRRKTNTESIVMDLSNSR